MAAAKSEAKESKPKPARKSRPASQSANLPNLVMCRLKVCRYIETYDPAVHGAGRGLLCPKCGSTFFQIVCGSGPKPSAGRFHPCYLPAKAGRRCRKHNGGAVRGPAHPSFGTGKDPAKAGERGRLVPKNFQPAYNAAFNSPIAQRSQQHELAVIAAMEDDLAAKIETGESNEAWKRLQKSSAVLRGKIAALAKAEAASDGEQVDQIRNDIHAIVEVDLLPVIDGGATGDAARVELLNTFVKRARLIRVQHLGEKTVPTEMLATIHARFMALLIKYVPDEEVRARLAAEIAEENLPGWVIADPVVRKLLKIAAERDAGARKDGVCPLCRRSLPARSGKGGDG